jgi:vitamin B12 transporter
VLVDGVRIGSSTSGLTALQDIPVDSIDRIEIVRGPRSSLYGSEAIGGVIQIFTRREKSGTRPRVRVGAAAMACAKPAPVSTWHRHAGGSASTAAGSTTTASTPVVVPGRRPTPVVASPSPDPDRDGYRDAALSLHGGIHATDALTLEANALRSEGHNAYDSNPDFGLADNSETVQQVVGGKLRYAPGSRITLQLTAGRNIDASWNFIGDVFNDRFDSRRDSARLQGDIELRPGSC